MHPNISFLIESFKSESNIYETFKIRGEEVSLTKSRLGTINNILRDRIQSVINIGSEKFCIAGGSVLSLLMYNDLSQINDIDIFPNTFKDYIILKEKLFNAFRNKKSKIKIREVNSLKLVITKKAYKFTFDDIKIDLIKYPCDTIDKLLKSFDISVTKVGFDENQKFHSQVAMAKVFNFKADFVTTITYETCMSSLNRVMKYSRKGFFFHPEVLAKIFVTIQTKLDSNDSSLNALSAENEAYRLLNHSYCLNLDLKSNIEKKEYSFEVLDKLPF